MTSPPSRGRAGARPPIPANRRGTDSPAEQQFHSASKWHWLTALRCRDRKIPFLLQMRIGPGWALSLVLPIAIAASATASAATVPTSPTFSVNAAIVQGCVVFGSSSQTTGITLGTINFGSHAALHSGTINAMAGNSMGGQARLVCTPGTAVQISVNGGQHPVGVQRRMSNGAGKFIPYSLTLMQGTLTGLLPNTPVGITTDGTPTALPVQGTVTLPGAGMASGTYSDSVQVVVSW